MTGRAVVTELCHHISGESTASTWFEWYSELTDEERRLVERHIERMTGLFYRLGVAARNVGSDWEELGKRVRDVQEGLDRQECQCVREIDEADGQ